MYSKNIVIGLSILTAVVLSACAAKTVQGNSSGIVGTKVSNGLKVHTVKRVSFGKASWYGKRFDGKKTASGEIFRIGKKTAAHRIFPFGTMVKVTNIANNRSVVVRINDRGPYSGNRIIDLSYAGAKAIGLIERGVADVKVEIVSLNSKQSNAASLPVTNERCVGDDCIATIGKSKRSPSRAKPFALLANNLPKDKSENQKMESIYGEELLTQSSSSNHYGSKSNLNTLERDPYVTSRAMEHFPKIESFNQKTSIQVGAFRKHAGATVYAKRYSLLSKYKTVIKNGTKDAKPLYRVQIEGFSSELEAREFISKHQYSLNGAFLVRR